MGLKHNRVCARRYTSCSRRVAGAKNVGNTKIIKSRRVNNDYASDKKNIVGTVKRYIIFVAITMFGGNYGLVGFFGLHATPIWFATLFFSFHYSENTLVRNILLSQCAYVPYTLSPKRSQCFFFCINITISCGFFRHGFLGFRSILLFPF